MAGSEDDPRARDSKVAGAIMVCDRVGLSMETALLQLWQLPMTDRLLEEHLKLWTSALVMFGTFFENGWTLWDAKPDNYGMDEGNYERLQFLDVAALENRSEQTTRQDGQLLYKIMQRFCKATVDLLGKGGTHETWRQWLVPLFENMIDEKIMRAFAEHMFRLLGRKSWLLVLVALRLIVCPDREDFDVSRIFVCRQVFWGLWLETGASAQDLTARSQPTGESEPAKKSGPQVTTVAVGVSLLDSELRPSKRNLTARNEPCKESEPAKKSGPQVETMAASPWNEPSKESEPAEKSGPQVTTMAAGGWLPPATVQTCVKARNEPWKESPREETEPAKKSGPQVTTMAASGWLLPATVQTCVKARKEPRKESSREESEPAEKSGSQATTMAASGWLLPATVQRTLHASSCLLFTGVQRGSCPRPKVREGQEVDVERVAAGRVGACREVRFSSHEAGLGCGVLLAAELRQRMDASRELSEWGPTVCVGLLGRSALVMFQMLPKEEGDTAIELLCNVKEKDVEVIESVQHVQAHVLAATPRDVSHMLKEGERKHGLLRVELVCSTAWTPTDKYAERHRVRRCMHVNASLARVYWDQMNRDSWPKSLQDWHEIVVGKTQKRAEAPKLTLETLEKAMKDVTVVADQRGFYNKPIHDLDTHGRVNRKTTKLDEKPLTREEREAEGITYGDQQPNKRMRDIPSYRHKPLTALLRNLHQLLPLERCNETGQRPAGCRERPARTKPRKQSSKTDGGMFKFAQHGMVLQLNDFIEEKCFVQPTAAAEEQDFGFVPAELHNVARGLVAFLREIQAVAAQATSLAFTHMRYLSAYVRLHRATFAQESVAAASQM
ncbi:unnamed protein product [Symbiodinium sp. CCMP2592]|nr:unnamed protein product [Symbiodinium sp. CCMP2592]